MGDLTFNMMVASGVKVCGPMKVLHQDLANGNYGTEVYRCGESQAFEIDEVDEAWANLGICEMHADNGNLVIYVEGELS